MTEASAMTKVTANPIPSAVSTFLETPRNGQEGNLERTKLLTSIELRSISNMRDNPSISVLLSYASSALIFY